MIHICQWLEHHGVPSSSISRSHVDGWLTISEEPVVMANATSRELVSVLSRRDDNDVVTPPFLRWLYKTEAYVPAAMDQIPLRSWNSGMSTRLRNSSAAGLLTAGQPSATLSSTGSDASLCYLFARLDVRGVCVLTGSSSGDWHDSSGNLRFIWYVPCISTSLHAVRKRRKSLTRQPLFCRSLGH
jgi:hypothetical protein